MNEAQAGKTVLREAQQTDLPIFFEQQLNPDAIYMAAFTTKDPTNRPAFMEKWARILDNPTCVVRTIEVDGEVAGYVSKYEEDGKPEVTYWLGHTFWGKNIATEALQAFLAELDIRPIYARAASDNYASIRVLLKCGFVITGAEVSFANARNEEIEEILLSLE
ncbi:MAG TPA: GNAT family N-acetyltransferase [Chloroflexia bacterium]|nr:GNAT family N-acetyltransferase [Chloroflexia bacterium]